MRLSAEDSSEPGQFGLDRAPYQREILDAISDPAIQEVVVKSSAQIGKTTLLKAVIGYHIDADPAPMLMLQPTLEMAESFSKDRLAPMIRDTPTLRGKIADPRARDSGNTLLHKRFTGGHVTLAGANSPASLASRPIRIVMCDEVDRYPPSAGTEGDPVDLARKRTATFWNRKVILVSTPTKEGVSRIDAAWQESDQRRFFVPCPHCSEYHTLEWANIRYEQNQPEAAMMACPNCGGLFGDSDKPRMLRHGQWRPTAKSSGIAGFHVSELYSPWRTYGQIAADYERVQDKPEQLRVWINTSLGECYEEKGEAPEAQRLYDRRERYPSNVVPEDVVFLTAGVDVQADRLEIEIVGWYPGKRSYQIDYRVILGDTSKVDGDGSPWIELARIIGTEAWPRKSGAAMPLRFTAIDSGYRTTVVYDFCRKFPISRVAPVKGRDDQIFVISPPRAIDRKRGGTPVRGTKLYTIGSSVIKSELYGWLHLDKAEDGTPPPGYCHFNEDRDLQYFKDLTSEKLVTRMIRGFPRHVWVRDPNLRNEALDCRVYARAAAAIVGMDRWKEKDWTREASVRDSVQPLPEPAKPEARMPKPKRRSDFWR